MGLKSGQKIKPNYIVKSWAMERVLTYEERKRISKNKLVVERLKEIEKESMAKERNRWKEKKRLRSENWKLRKSEREKIKKEETIRK